MVTTQKEIKSLEAPQVQTELMQARTELQNLRGKAAASDLKNVRAIRTTRTLVARLSTRLHELKATPHS